MLVYEVEVEFITGCDKHGLLKQGYKDSDQGQLKVKGSSNRMLPRF